MIFLLLHFPISSTESYSCSTTSPIFSMFNLFNFSSYDKSVAVYLLTVLKHSPNDQWLWASSRVLIYHLCILLSGYPCLENPMDRGAWYATVHGVAKSQTRPSDFTYLLITIIKSKTCYMMQKRVENTNCLCLYHQKRNDINPGQCEGNFSSLLVKKKSCFPLPQKL